LFFRRKRGQRMTRSPPPTPLTAAQAEGIRPYRRSETVLRLNVAPRVPAEVICQHQHAREMEEAFVHRSFHRGGKATVAVKVAVPLPLLGVGEVGECPVSDPLVPVRVTALA